MPARNSRRTAEPLAVRLGVAGARFAAPENTVRALTAAISAGDLKQAAECFAEVAAFVTPDGTAVRGREAIITLLAQMVEQKAVIDVEPSGLLTVGDLALLNQRWRMTMRSNSAGTYTQLLTPLLILRQHGSQWKCSLVSPWQKS